MALSVYTPPSISGSHGTVVVFSPQVKNLTEEVESLSEDVSKLQRAARVRGRPASGPWRTCTRKRRKPSP